MNATTEDTHMRLEVRQALVDPFDHGNKVRICDRLTCTWGVERASGRFERRKVRQPLREGVRDREQSTLRRAQPDFGQPRSIDEMSA